MIEIDKKEKCCGCTACYSACPNKCILMKEDEEGFKYPIVDKSKCTECHICESVCPINRIIGEDSTPRAFLARTQDPELLRECTSGGVFTTIARHYAEKDGIVYGAVYDKNFNVIHKRINYSEVMSQLPGSKYVQSDIGQVFFLIRDDLEKGEKVLFCGTPCQVAGLIGYLKRDYDNLFLIDFVCHGVPSPFLWREYTSFLKNKYGSISYINFRSKYLGYHTAVMEERFQSGMVQIGSARTNLMLRCYFNNIADRPICYECPFKSISHYSDLTLFDGWHASEYVADLNDDDNGYTIVLTQSEKGLEYLKSSDELITYSIDPNKAIQLDGRMICNSVDKPVTRDVFYKYLKKNGIEKTVELLLPIDWRDRLIDRSKIVLDTIGFLKLIRKVEK